MDDALLPPTLGDEDTRMPDALPIQLQPGNWHDFTLEDARKVWEHYEKFILKHGYHIAGSTIYETLGSDVTEIPPPAADPFHPNDTEFFIKIHKPKNLLATRMHSEWQPSPQICFGIDRFQREAVFKAIPYESTELKVLRMLASPSLRADKRNCIIPILDLWETRDFVIAVMASWGWCWESPPCGNMSTRCEMALKLTDCLAWLHEQGIAHGDLHTRNIVINHSDGRDRKTSAEDDFRKTHHVEYAIIDFGSAHIFSPGSLPMAAAITTPPDPYFSPEQDDSLENGVLIDVFAADVYNLGKTLEAEFVKAFERYGKGYLPEQEYEQYRDILSAMTDPQPENRPTSTEVVARLREALPKNGEGRVAMGLPEASEVN